MADLTTTIPARARHWGGESVLVALIAVYLLGTSLWPLLRLFAEAFGPGEAATPFALIRETIGTRAVSRAFGNTLASSLGSVVISTVLGGGLALLLCLIRLRGRVAMTFLILSPLLIPSQILSLAWIELLGSSSPLLGPLGLAPGAGQTNPLYSGPGIMLILGIENMPLVFLAMRAALIAIPQSLIEAARISGASAARITGRIVLPLTWPALTAGAVLAFAAAVGNFGVPALLGIPGRYPVLTTLIYQRLNGFGPSVIGQVAVLSLILVVLAGGALGLRMLLSARAVPVDRVGAPLEPFDTGRLRPLAEAGIWALLLILAIAPMLALLATALTPTLGVRLTPGNLTLDHFGDSLASPLVRRAFMNSFALSLAAAIGTGLAALVLGWLSVVRRHSLARGMDMLADAAFVVPGTVLAVAYILVFLRPLPLIGVSIYATPVILVVAYLARFLPLVLRPVAGAMHGLEPGVDEAARILGAGPLRRLTRIAAPMVAPSVMAGAVLVFITAFNELTVSALLWSSGVETVGVTIFSQQYEGNSTGAAALSILSIGVVLALAYALDRQAHRLPSGTLPWRE